MAPASGDQLVTALGTWNKGIIPGIRSTDIAEDVYDDNLNILLEDKIEDKNHFSAAFLNAKGFRNNASALILSQEKSKELLKQKHSKNK